MTTGGLQAWLVPVFVTAAIVLIVLIDAGVSWYTHRDKPPAEPVSPPTADRRLQTVGLGLLVLLAIAVVVMAGLGPNRADQFASVIAALLGAVSAVLAFFSYRDNLEFLRANRDREAAATGTPDPAPPQPDGSSPD
ncbi:hypothetical protein ACWT_1381 [Actinoplanes sp. SE50]|uniref:hypothetical protein n=1 Tax=unclassified Actinoplanes TaxID=2626549 RepID=UPI00023EC048|nr:MULTISPECIES: hypothetical protein [unclassified Actinoplanes]AEV82399.1 hypothetical protein ACPL_1502 [Actinoplanes sp. SE50/110]ATO80796.1 hypothetical protein ACWT_1381 [Actinoplanes sp. SE50]SLL98204.1 hypothetical protein ACSP50_1428 [Actinoplanes sp. SE50/110]